ncbi:unnamed protein product, partial [Prorocentrum cordatum]
PERAQTVPPQMDPTVLAAWGATWSECWSLSGGAAPVGFPAPFPGHCNDEAARPCSCDAELRRIIALQADGDLGAAVPARDRLLGAEVPARLEGVSRAGGYAGQPHRGAGLATPSPTATAPDARALALTTAPASGGLVTPFKRHGRHCVCPDVRRGGPPDPGQLRGRRCRHQKVFERRAELPAHLAEQIYAHDPISWRQTSRKFSASRLHSRSARSGKAPRRWATRKLACCPKVFNHSRASDDRAH